MMSLIDLLEEVRIDLKDFDAISRKLTVHEAFNGPYKWLTDAPAAPYPRFLKAAILRIPLPRVYVHERNDGVTFDVLVGGELIECMRMFTNELRAKQSDYSSGTDEFMLNRRVLYTEIEVVKFRFSMSWEDAKTAVEFVK